MAAFLGDRESLQPSGSKRKRGGKKGAAVAAQPSQNDSDDGATAKKVKKTVREVSEEPEGSPEVAISQAKGISWPKEDVEMLIEKLSGVLPETDTVKYNTQAEKLKWDEVVFKDYTADECKEQWTAISTKLRRYRTMTELVNDAKEWSKQPWKTFTKKQQRHPDMPKKPLTPYFRYFMEKRAKHAKSNPNMSMTEISQHLAAKFRSLADKKKQKYIDSYNKENEVYKIAHTKFKEEHPELYPEKESTKKEKRDIESRSRDGHTPPPKASTPLSIFVQLKTEEHMKKNPELTKKQGNELFRVKWNELPDSKKLKYIDKALDARKQYDIDLKAYCESHPDYKPKACKSFLTKVEQKMKDKQMGKPDKPPPNGYGLFSSELLPQLTDVASNERMAEVSRQWKQLPDGQKDNYNKKAQQKMADYKEEYQKYLSKLPADLREKEEGLESKKAKPAKVQEVKPIQSRTKQPHSALFAFIKERREKYKKRYPHMDQQELTRLMAREFSALAPEEKAVYEKKQEVTPTSPSPKKANAKANLAFPMAPKKPPSSGYALFSTEMLSKLPDTPTQQRMGVISGKWREMTDAERNGYKKKRDTMQRQFLKAMEKFKKSLSPKDLKRFEEQEEAKKKGKKGKTATKSKAKQPAKQESEPESDESEEEKEKSDSESNSGSGSGSGEDSGSESDAEDNNNDEDSGSGSGSDAESGSEAESPSQSASPSASDSSASESESESEDEAKKPVQNGPTSKDKESDSDSDSDNSSSSGASGSGSGSEDSGSESD